MEKGVLPFRYSDQEPVVDAETSPIKFQGDNDDDYAGMYCGGKKIFLGHIPDENCCPHGNVSTISQSETNRSGLPAPLPLVSPSTSTG